MCDLICSLSQIHFNNNIKTDFHFSANFFSSPCLFVLSGKPFTFASDHRRKKYLTHVFNINSFNRAIKPVPGVQSGHLMSFNFCYTQNGIIYIFIRGGPRTKIDFNFY